MSPRKVEIKVGQKFELASNQDMWKDDLSGVFLRAPGKYKISRPKDTDYRTQLDWYASTRFKDPKEVFWKEDEGNTWFEVTKDMNTDNIKIALIKGTLVKKGKTDYTTKKVEKEPKRTFKTDPNTGQLIYDGPNKNIFKLLNKNKMKQIVDTIKGIQDPRLLEIMAEMESKGLNPARAPRDVIMTTIEKQLNENSMGLSRIKEEDVEVKDLSEVIKENKEKEDK